MFFATLPFFVRDVTFSHSFSLDDLLSGERQDSGTAMLAVLELATGGLAGACAKTVIAPGDRIKILYQVNSARNFTYKKGWKTAKNVVRHHGPMGLWRGHGATLLRVIPSSAISYYTFEVYSRAIRRFRQDESNMYTRFVCGAAAGATATAITYPLDLLRARMAAHWHGIPLYRSYGVAFGEIAQKEGTLALWNGLRPTLIGVLPYAGISFSCFHTLKSYIRRQYGLEDDRAVPTALR